MTATLTKTEERMLLNAALICASHRRANPLTFDIRGRRQDVPPLWGSYRMEPGPPFARRGFGEVNSEEAGFWLGICAALTGPARDGHDSFLRKGFTAACRLTGIGWTYISKAIYDVRFFGAEAAGNAWALYMRPADERCIGEIYVAHAVGQPDVVKVGFSTQIEKRLATLTRQEGRKVVLDNLVPGTLLHEWALHAQIPGAVKSEWYPRENIPSWLLEAA